MLEFSKKELEDLKKMEGEVNGVAFKNDFEFILKKEGENGVIKVEKEMANLGYPITYIETNKLAWYPEAANAILLVAQKLFNWDDAAAREMGRFAAKMSFITRIMMVYFISPEALLKIADKYWRKYHLKGSLVPINFDNEKRRGSIELRDYNTGFPSHCRYLEGYFEQIVSYVLPKMRNLKIRETECLFTGGKVHKFEAEW